MKSLPVLLLAGCACLCHAGVPDDRAFLSQLQEKEAQLRHQDLSPVVGTLPAGQLSGVNQDFIARLQQQQQARVVQGPRSRSPPYSILSPSPSPAKGWSSCWPMPTGCISRSVFAG